MSKLYNWKNVIKDDELDEVVDIIKRDGIVVFPTETVYGIGGNALSKNVIKNIYNIKKRPQEKALNILVKSKEDIKKIKENKKLSKKDSIIDKKVLKKVKNNSTMDIEVFLVVKELISAQNKIEIKKD